MGATNFNYGKDGNNTLGVTAEILYPLEEWKEDQWEAYEDCYDNFEEWLENKHSLTLEGEELQYPKVLNDYKIEWEEYVDKELEELYEEHVRDYMLTDKLNEIQNALDEINQDTSAYKLDVVAGYHEGFTVIMIDAPDGISSGSDILDERTMELEQRLCNKYLEKIKHEYGGELIENDGWSGHKIVRTEINPEKLEGELEELSTKLGSLWEDKELFLQSVEKEGIAVASYAFGEYSPDKETLLKAIDLNPVLPENKLYANSLFMYNYITKDRDVILAAVSKDGQELDYLDRSFKDDIEIVRAAVNQNKDSIEFASARLQKHPYLLNEYQDLLSIKENVVNRINELRGTSEQSKNKGKDGPIL